MTSNASCSSFGLRAAAALLARTGMKANRRPTRQSCKADHNLHEADPDVLSRLSTLCSASPQQCGWYGPAEEPPVQQRLCKEWLGR